MYIYFKLSNASYQQQNFALFCLGDAWGVVVIVVGNEHGNPISSPRRGYVYFI